MRTLLMSCSQAGQLNLSMLRGPICGIEEGYVSSSSELHHLSRFQWMIRNVLEERKPLCA